MSNFEINSEQKDEKRKVLKKLERIDNGRVEYKRNGNTINKNKEMTVKLPQGTFSSLFVLVN